MGSRPSTPSFRPEPYTGTITVSIRPNPHSNSVHHQNWSIDSHSNTISNLSDNSSFSFDHIFPATTHVSNRDVYMRLCSQLVKSFLNEGYNSTLFAYGMTGSGKTYSMRGEDHDPGFVRLAIDEIFETIAVANSTRKHLLSVSYLEIYNEKIVDLLSNSAAQTDLKIRDDPEYGTQIVGATTPMILSKDHLLLLIRTGDTKRKTSATDYNARSSRSHAILQLRLHVVDVLSNKESYCTLSLCDLAGSERAASSLERRKEGAFINKSLLALSTVINKLSLLSTSPAMAMEHIPYRDSKLTRLLQPALSGSSLVLILCTIHLGSNLSAVNQQFISETYNTLRFAARAKDIVMTVKTNEKSAVTDTEAQRLVAELQKTVDVQRNEIQMLKMVPRASGGVNDVESAGLRAEVSVLNEKLEHLTRLNDLQKTETILLRNDTLNDILGIDADQAALQMMMSNLEEFYKRVNYELEEYKLYIGHLELQLKQARQQILLQGSNNIERGMSDNNFQELLKEQEEEIWQLKETIKDKDRIIYGLTKTSKLRRLVDSNSTSVSEFTKRPSFSSLASISSSPGKENVFSDIKAFNLSPKREQS